MIGAFRLILVVRVRIVIVVVIRVVRVVRIRLLVGFVIVAGC